MPPCAVQLASLEPVCRLGEGGFSTVTLTRDGATGPQTALATIYNETRHSVFLTYVPRTGAHYAMKTMDKTSVVKNALARKVKATFYNLH